MNQEKANNPQILEQSENNIIIAVSDTEIGKILLPSPYVLVNAETGEPIDFLNERRTLDFVSIMFRERDEIGYFKEYYLS